MDRNTFTGLFLILVILVGSTFLLKPSEEEIKREQIVQDSIAATKNNPQAIAKSTPVLTDSLAKTDSASTGISSVFKEELAILENSALKITLSNKGGKIVS